MNGKPKGLSRTMHPPFTVPNNSLKQSVKREGLDNCSPMQHLIRQEFQNLEEGKVKSTVTIQPPYHAHMPIEGDAVKLGQAWGESGAYRRDPSDP